MSASSDRLALLPEYSPSLNEHFQVFRSKIWIEINAYLRKMSLESFSLELERIKSQVSQVITTLLSFSADPSSSYQDISSIVDNLLNSLYEYYESLPSNIRDSIDDILESNLIGAKKIADSLIAWSNVCNITEYLALFQKASLKISQSTSLKKRTERKSSEMWASSENFKFQKILIEKGVCICREQHEHWKVLGLPSLIGLIRDFCLYHMTTLTSFQSIVGPEYILEEQYVFKDLDQTVSSFLFWANYLDFYIKLFGYWTLPADYKERIIPRIANYPMKVLMKGLFTESHNEFLGIIKAQKLVSDLFIGIGLIPLISRHLCIELCNFISSVSILLKKKLICDIPEMLTRDAQEPEFKQFLNGAFPVAQFCWNKRNALSRVLDNSIRYIVDITLIEETFGIFRQKDYVRLRYPLIEEAIPQLLFFAIRKLSNEPSIIFRMCSSIFDHSPKIDEHHLVIYCNQPNYPTWDGDVVEIHDPLLTPPIFVNTFAAGRCYIIFTNLSSACNFFYNYPQRKNDSLAEFPPRPFDQELAKAMEKLDENLMIISEGLMDSIQLLVDLELFTKLPTVGKDFFTLTSIFASNFIKDSRVPAASALRPKILEFCHAWSRFHHGANKLKKNNSFLEFIESGTRAMELSIKVKNKDEIMKVFDQFRHISLSGNERFEVVDFPSIQITHWDQFLTSRHQLISNERHLIVPGLGSTSIQNKHSPKFKWQRLCKIGVGTFGTLFEVMNVDTGKIIAMKEMKNATLDSGSSIYDHVVSEFELIYRLHHLNIIKYYALELCGDYVRLFMEHCGAGSLSRRITLGPICDRSRLQRYCRHILEGLAFLHENHIIHRDLKPDNIMLNSQGTLKLVDFGSFLDLKAPKAPRKTSFIFSEELVGTPAYMAPEIILGGATTDKADMWSFGCTLYQLASGIRPWVDIENDWGIIFVLGKGDMSKFMKNYEFIDKWTMSVISRCLNRNPQGRPSAKDLLNDPYTQRNKHWD